jgi:hypothetical protein
MCELKATATFITSTDGYVRVMLVGVQEKARAIQRANGLLVQVLYYNIIAAMSWLYN